MGAATAAFYRCSFCDALARDLPDDTNLIIAHSAAICSVCVDTCVDIIARERTQAVAKAGEAQAVGASSLVNDAENTKQPSEDPPS